MLQSSILYQDVPELAINEFNPAEANKDNEEKLEQEDSMTNGGFSDSQFGDIADEENYTGLPAEASANSPKIKINGNEDTVILNYGRPTAAGLSGKYTSCTNKNESLSFQANKRLVTIRAINNTSQTEYAPL